MKKFKLTKRGNFSTHTKISEAAKCYGWDEQNARYHLNRYKSFNGYEMMEIQEDRLNVSIPLKEFQSFMAFECMLKLYQTSDFNNEIDGIQSVRQTLGTGEEYRVKLEVTNRIARHEIATDANGFNLDDIDGNVEIDVIRVTNSHGEEVVLDEETEDKLIKNIIL